MKLDHVALYVNDIEIMKEFYIKYFNAIVNAKSNDIKTKMQTYLLSFGGGACIEIIKKTSINEIKNDTSMRYCDITFRVGSKKKVNELTWKLMTDKFEVIREPKAMKNGNYESCIFDPEGNRIKIIA